MPPIKDSTLDLEHHELHLRNTKSNLIRSMRHWQLWGADYEGLKEEILSFPSTPIRTQLVEICSQYDGDLVSKTEIKEILGTTTPRDTPQVINLLDRRIDYVEKNVCSLQKQIAAVDKKLAAFSVISTTGVLDEGLPFTEIIEELDENDNIISSYTSTPNTSIPQIGEMLQKSELKNNSNSPINKVQPVDFIEDKDLPQEAKRSTRANQKRSVSFTEDTKLGPDLEKSNTAKRLEEIMKLARKQEEFSFEPPIIPDNESAEDSALRREMLEYGMSEIGTVVAELELEEDESNWTSDDVSEDSDDSDMEDAHGRYTGKVITEDLRQKMAKIQQRLGTKSMTNIKDKTSDFDIVEEGIGRITISTKGVEATSDTKTVRFAENLDIAPCQASESTINSKTVSDARLDPVGDIVERNTYNDYKSHTNHQRLFNSKAISSVNTTVMSQKRTVPEGPPGVPLAETIMERDTPSETLAIESDEIDPHLLQQEIATEYYKMRNLMIQRQGGFMRENESERVEFTEEEGGPKKISRFKATRLARS